MHLLFELSKEFPALPRDEILACFHTEKIPYEILIDTTDVIALDVTADMNHITKISQHLALTFTVDELLFRCHPTCEDLAEKAYQHEIKQEGSLVIRYRNRSDSLSSQPFVKTLADVYTRNRSVDLHHPDHEIRIVLTNDCLFVGKKIHEIDRSAFEKRKVQHRPFFSPVSLHPKIARALVNLSKVGTDGILLDPFCGTGGILLEAGLLGLSLVGCDIESSMIEGTTNMLRNFTLPSDQLYCCDIGELSTYVKRVDGVATDFPYGKSTTTKGESRESLYHRAFKALYEVVKPGGRVVAGLPDTESVSIGESFFTLDSTYIVPVHRSLTRYFSVFSKEP